jgi:hypothetical protein
MGFSDGGLSTVAAKSWIATPFCGPSLRIGLWRSLFAASRADSKRPKRCEKEVPELGENRALDLAISLQFNLH